MKASPQDSLISAATELPKLFYRDLISKLISLLCYESSYSQDSATIIQVAGSIATESKYHYLRESIKTHLPIPKLNDPTWSQQDFFMLFRNHRILRILGLSLPMESVCGIDRKTKIKLQIGASNGDFISFLEPAEESSETELELEVHLNLFKCYRELQNISSNEKFSTMVGVPRHFRGMLNTN